jgi:hypothetical protein
MKGDRKDITAQQKKEWPEAALWETRDHKQLRK